VNTETALKAIKKILEDFNSPANQKEDAALEALKEIAKDTTCLKTTS
jgi:hypothetical protein